MGKLDALKITDCPLAFASFAEKHNAVVDMLAAIEGRDGISVVVAEKNAVISANIANTGGGGTIVGNTATVVGSSGLLQNVYVGNPIANSWPSVGKYVTASGNVDVSSTGVVLTTTGGKTCSIAFSAITQSMSIQNVVVCDSGVTKHMLVLASAAF